MKWLKILFSSVYFILIIYLVFFAERRKNQSIRFLNIVPLTGTISYFKSLNLKDTRELHNFYYNLFGNILLFVPFSIILILQFNVHKNRTIIMASFLFSILIECIQYIFEKGVADIDDVLLN